MHEKTQTQRDVNNREIDQEKQNKTVADQDSAFLSNKRNVYSA